MGKASQCIKMLEILNSGRVYKCSELASILETNSRNIIEYKKELEECGYYINSIPGRYGGYQLEKSYTLPTLTYNEKQKEIISQAQNYLSNRNDFPYKHEFDQCMGKLFTALKHEDFMPEPLIITHYPLRMNEEQIKKLYDTMLDAIKYKHVVRLKYESQKKTVREYYYHPYELFMYNNAWFVIGWNEKFGNISYFKLNRMSELEITEKRFSVWKQYNRSDYIDEFGFKNNGEWYHVEFIAKNIYAQLVKERLYGKNQVVSVIDEHHTRVEVDMQNQEDIFTFFLGFGKEVEVIEPKWAIEEMKDYAEFISENYK